MNPRTELKEFLTSCTNPLYYAFLTKASQTVGLLVPDVGQALASTDTVSEELWDVALSLKNARSLRFLAETGTDRLQELALHLWRKYYRVSHAPGWLEECPELLAPTTPLKQLIALHHDRLAFLPLQLFEMRVQGVPSPEVLINMARTVVVNAMGLLTYIQGCDWDRFVWGVPSAPFRTRVEHLHLAEDLCS